VLNTFQEAVKAVSAKRPKYALKRLQEASDPPSKSARKRLRAIAGTRYLYLQGNDGILKYDITDNTTTHLNK
jgi:hypothetical protein